MGRLQRKKSPVKVKKKSNKNYVVVGGTVSGGSGNVKSVVEEKKRYVPLAKASSAEHGDKFFSGVFSFFKESKLELKKVVWPSRKQAIGSTFVVIVIVSLVSLFLGAIDAGLSGMIRAVLR